MTSASPSIMEPAFLNGVGPRVETDGLNASPYEDLKLKKK